MKVNRPVAVGHLPYCCWISKMAALRKLFFRLVELSIGLTLVLSGCLSNSIYNGATQLPIPSPPPSDIMLSLEEVPLKEGLSFYQDPVSWELFSENRFMGRARDC